MRRCFAAALLALAAGAAGAQTPAPMPPPETGADLIQRGAGIILENLLREIQPRVEGMSREVQALADRLGPALGELAEQIDDIRNYQAPERLPNGDILIRRKPEAPPPPPIGDALRDLTRPAPEGAPTPVPPPMPTGPQIAL